MSNWLRVRQAAGTSLLITLVVIALLFPSTPPSKSSPPPDPPARPAVSGLPNIVLVLTDDQRWDTLWAMPTVHTELVGKGVKFANAFVVNPTCCPSRASILTGQYSHSTGVWANGGDYGGFDAFQEVHGDDSTVATWLDAAGYHTGLVGKYLNHYDDPSYIPPGWDEWAGLLAESEGKYYDYVLNLNGHPTHYGHTPADYSTDVMANWAVDFIQSAPADQPLFLYMGTKSPHGSAIPAPRDRNGFRDYTVPHTPDFNESDVSDKPGYIRAQRLASDSRAAKYDRGRTLVLRALQSVDDAVARILAALRQSGRMNNTMFVFTSDNGNLWGEHRWVAKGVPYEESIRVPIVVRYDPLVTGPAKSEAMALNIDLAPTFTDVAGVQAPGAEGHSLLPLLADPSLPGRGDFVIEHVQQIKKENLDPVPTYCALRTRNSLFVQYATGEREYYDLGSDPWELRNLAGGPAVASKITAARGRASVLCDPLPPGFPADLL